MNKTILQFFLFSIGAFNFNLFAQVYQSCDENQIIRILNDKIYERNYEFSWDFKDCPLDFSSHRFIGFNIENNSSSKIILDISHHPKPYLENSARFIIAPNQFKTCEMMITRQKPNQEDTWKSHFEKVRGYPGGYVTHWAAPSSSKIEKLFVKISLSKPLEEGDFIGFDHPFGIGELEYDSNTLSKLSYPILDKMGQFNAEKWRGKLHSIDTLEFLGNQDYKDFHGISFNSNLSKYGGWKNGPKQEAKGFFYTKRFDGKWWFVDPDGYLFWSLGITGIGGGSATKTTSREVLFSDLSLERLSVKKYQDSMTLAASYHKRQAKEYLIFKPDKINFYYLNLKRKYGENWIQKHQDVTAGRLKNWGVNTYGAWSKKSDFIEHPYTIIIHPKLQGIGKIDKLPDPFSLEFSSALKKSLQRIAHKNSDPWLLGVFVNNEIHWEHKFSLMDEILSLKNKKPARKAFEKFLKKKYGSINSLNSVWTSNFTSFNNISGDNKAMFSSKFTADLELFFSYFADTYYKIVSTEFKKIFPNHLYLGSRLYGKSKFNKNLHEIAAKYCDVVSFNIYDYGVKDFKLLSKIDKPMLIGEFHFGTASQGVWGSGLRNASSLENQANLYMQYIEEASQHTQFIGAHWFQWSDQPTTGRSDGENFRIGVVSITDQPYSELVEAIKKVSKTLYVKRKNKL
jgi:hypothetical protein